MDDTMKDFLNQRFGALERGMSRVEDRLGEIERGLAGQSAEHRGLAHRVDGLEDDGESVQKIRVRMALVEQTLEILTAKVSAIESRPRRRRSTAIVGAGGAGAGAGLALFYEHAKEFIHRLFGGGS